MFVFKPSCCCCFWSQWKLTEQWLLSLHYVYASELLSTTCHEVRSVWAAVLYWKSGFSGLFFWNSISNNFLCWKLFFYFPSLIFPVREKIHSTARGPRPLLWFIVRSNAGRFSAQERRDNFGLCQAKKPSKGLNGQRFHDSTMCIILFNVLLDLMTCHLRYVTVCD